MLSSLTTPLEQFLPILARS